MDGSPYVFDGSRRLGPAPDPPPSPPRSVWATVVAAWESCWRRCRRMAQPGCPPSGPSLPPLPAVELATAPPADAPLGAMAAVIRACSERAPLLATLPRPAAAPLRPPPAAVEPASKADFAPLTVDATERAAPGAMRAPAATAPPAPV